MAAEISLWMGGERARRLRKRNLLRTAAPAVAAAPGFHYIDF
jgi:hypothetical protein